MSTLQVANIHFESTQNTRIQFFGSNSVGVIAGGANSLVTNNTVTTLQVNSSNVVVANTTVTQIQVAGSNAVVANSTVTTLAAAGIPELTVNTTAAVFAGTIADATATLRPLVNAAVTSLTTQTAVDFTGIPSWVKRITLAFRGVSTSGSSPIIVQLGTSASFTTTGYLNGVLNSGGSGTQSNNTITNGLAIDSGGAGSLGASTVRHGTMTILNIDGNNWVSSSIVGFTQTNIVEAAGGSVALSDTLTRLRLNTFGGTETFDAGSVNVLYE